MVGAKKGDNLVNISRKSLINIAPKSYATYHNPSLSGSQDIVLTRFFYCFNGRAEKGT